MSGVIQLAAVGVAAALCAVVVKKQTPELGLALVLLAGTILLGAALPWLEEIADFLQELADAAGLAPETLAPVLKVLGISVTSHTAAEVCRDAKEGALASFLETSAAALALLSVLPLLRAVLNMITGLL